MCVFGVGEVVVCRPSSPLHTACTGFRLGVQALCLKGKPVRLCDPFFPPPVGFPLQPGMERRRESP